MDLRISEKSSSSAACFSTLLFYLKENKLINLLFAGWKYSFDFTLRKYFKVIHIYL
jgi:hypothetical protein